MANNLLLASDNFASGSLAVGWTQLPSCVAKTQVIVGTPNVSEPVTAANSTNYGQYWSAITWPNDQISEITINNLASVNNTFTSLVVRASASTTQRYQLDVAFSSGAYKLTVSSISSSGVVTQLGSPTATITPVAGDVVTFAAIGISISVYYNHARIFYIADTSIKSGFPGFIQLANSTSAIANTQVSSWRGYSAVQQDGIWTKQQIIATPLITDGSKGLELHSQILFEGGAQVLSGTVYKMWPDGNGNTYYAESLDCINWTFLGGATPTPVISGQNQTAVIKVGSTYYAYCQSTPGTTPIQCYTSTDGITFANQSTNCIATGSGTWDDFAIYPFYAIVNVAGTFYGFYGGTNSNAYLFSTGLATSTDGIAWTKYLGTGGPVITGGGNACGITQSAGVYYTWCQTAQPGQGNANAPDFDPAESVRYKSTNLTTWTKDVKSIHHSGMAESLNANTGYGTTNGYLMTVGGMTYNILTVGGGDAITPVVPQIMLATSTATIAQIVLNPEDAAQYVATDGFTGGAGSLGPNWTTPTGGTALQVVSGPYVEPTTTAFCSAVYTGKSFGANHFSEVTLEALTGTLGQSTIQPIVIMSAAAVTGYEGQILSPTGTSDAAARISKRVAGSGTVIGPTITIEPSLGDVFRLQVVTGSDGFPTLSLFQNGFLILQVQDTSTTPLTTGSPGIGAFSSLGIADAQISAWGGGNANVSPFLYSISGSAGVAGATVAWSGTSSGSTTADGSGNYTISGLANGSYTITPSLIGYTFSPTSSNQTVSGGNITGVNFVATLTPVTGHYSVPDARNYGNFPNLSTNVNGTLTYTVPAEYSLQYWFDILFNRTQPLPEDSRAAGKPVASRNISAEYRAPGVNGPGN